MYIVVYKFTHHNPLTISTDLLRCMSDIGKVGGNAFTPIDQMADLDDKETMESAASHPAFGFKCDLIRLIASLAYRHKANQDQVSYWDL